MTFWQVGNSHNSFNFRFCPKPKIQFSGDEWFEKVWAIVFAMSGMSETSTLFTFQCRVQIAELVYKVTIGDLFENFLVVVIPHCMAHCLPCNAESRSQNSYTKGRLIFLRTLFA